MIQITLFGWVFIPLLLAVALWARPWLPGLVLGSAVFQAAAVANVPIGATYFGISPYILSAGVAGWVMLWRVLGPDKSPISPPAHVRTPAMWLLTYAVVAEVGAFVLPHVFAGIPVQPPLDPNGYSLTNLPPLQWGISNLAQAINLCIHVVVAFFFWQAIKRTDWSFRKTISSFGIAAALAALAGLHDRFALVLEWPRMAWFWMSNLGYVQVEPYPISSDNVSTYFDFHRISSPFSEPSYGSAFFAATYAGSLASVLFGRRATAITLLTLIFSALALINTTGSTGWAAGFASTLFLIAAYTLKHCWALFTPNLSITTSWKRLTATVAGLTVVIAAVWFSPIGRAAPNIAQILIIEKAAALKNDGRFLSDLRAITLTQQTQGMGTGLGSNRTSSFLTSLLSNTGVAGTAVFLMMVASLAWSLLRAPSIATHQYFSAAALGTAVFSVSLAIPDLNLPLFWAFVFLAFASASSPIQGTNRPEASP